MLTTLVECEEYEYEWYKHYTQYRSVIISKIHYLLRFQIRYQMMNYNSKIVLEESTRDCGVSTERKKILVISNKVNDFHLKRFVTIPKINESMPIKENLIDLLHKFQIDPSTRRLEFYEEVA